MICFILLSHIINSILKTESNLMDNIASFGFLKKEYVSLGLGELEY